MRQICLTGATGVLGSALLTEQRPSQSCLWHVILRAVNDLHLEKRAQRLCKDLQIDKRYCRFYRGDVTQPNFQLSKNVTNKIISNCTHYVHAAGQVKLNLTLDAASAAAVNSTKTILNWYSQGVDRGVAKRLLFVSTVGVAGRQQGLIPESPGDGALGFHNTYEHAKFLAEKLVLEQSPPHTTIVRPSMIIGNSSTGAVRSFQVFYHLCDFFVGLRTGGVLPQVEDTQLDIIPIDVVVRSMVHLLNEPQTESPNIIHLSSGPKYAPYISVLSEDLGKIYTDKSIDLPKLSTRRLEEYVRALPSISVKYPQHREFQIGLHFLLPYLIDKQIFENSTLLGQPDNGLKNYKFYLGSVVNFYLSSYEARTNSYQRVS